jgi:hypothetical protein
VSLAQAAGLVGRRSGEQGVAGTTEVDAEGLQPADLVTGEGEDLGEDESTSSARQARIASSGSAAMW